MAVFHLSVKKELLSLKKSIKNVMIALHQCQKLKEKVKVSYHRKLWTFILKIEAVVNF
jgi:hypothetical protein